MNKFSEYLSIKIGIIVTAAGALLYHWLEIQLFPLFVCLLLISLTMWSSVWRVINENTPHDKQNFKFPDTLKNTPGLFLIHVLATCITPFWVGVFTKKTWVF